MKLNIKYLSFLLAGAAVLASCDKNEPNVFDDKDAFVAFDAVNVSYNEDYSAEGATFKIPVTLASVAGLEETVKFEIVAPEDSTKTAEAGVNYELVTTTGVLSFNAETRTQYIEFKTIADGEYRGDLSFVVKLLPSETLPVGAESECVVTIGDIDHPLTFMLGAYTATGENFWDGPCQWTITIYKDAEDVHKVWFDNLFQKDSWAAPDTRYYGIVSDDNTTINIPFGQTSEYLYSNGKPVTLLGFDGENGYDTGSVDAQLIVDGSKVTIDFGDEYGFWVWIEGAGNLNIVSPGITAVKN